MEVKWYMFVNKCNVYLVLKPKTQVLTYTNFITPFKCLYSKVSYKIIEVVHVCQ